MADGGDEGSLRPVRWPRRPRRGTLLRAGLVAALLGLAVAVLHTPAGCPPGPGDGPDASATTPRAGQESERDSPAAGSDPIRDRRSTGSDPAREGQPAGPLPLPSGAVGVPVRLAEPAAVAVLRPGSRVDLLVVRAGGPATQAELLASRALVLDVVGAGADDGSSALYLALRPDQAQRAVGLPEGSRFAVVVRD
jgi:hypothetical protein